MRRRAWRGWAPAVVAALMAASGAAHAQAPAKPTDAAAETKKRLDQADKHFNAGNAAADRKQWQKAEEEYLKAYALSPLPQILGALGEAELRLGKPREAAEHLARFLVEDKGAGSEERATATALLAEAKKEVVTLKITVTDVGAEVLIDDKVVGVAPLPEEVYVTPGTHTVVARLGTARDEVTGTYEKGWTRVMRLKPKEPGAAVVPTATATAGVTAEPTAKPEVKETGGPRKEIVIGGAALAGAALVAGAVFAGISIAKAEDAAGVRKGIADGACVDDESRCTKLYSVLDEQNAFGSLSVFSFVGAGVVGAATVTYWLLSPKGTMSNAASVRAGATMNGSGGKLVLEGRW